MAQGRAPTAGIARALIRSESRAYAWTAAAWVLWHNAPLLAGLLAKWFFDALLGKAHLPMGVGGVIALALLLGLGRAGVMRVAALAGTPMRFRQRARMQENVLGRILRLPGARAIDVAVGDAISTLRDDAQDVELAAHWPYDALAALLFGVCGIAILLSVSVRLTLLVFGPIALLLALSGALQSRLVRARERRRETTAAVTGAIGEIFTAVEAIQAAGAEERVLRRLGLLGEARRLAVVGDALQSGLFDAVFQYAAHLGAGLVLLLAAGAVRQGSFTVGDFALFATYLLQVADFMGFIGYLIGSYQQSGVSVHRMLRLMRGAPWQALAAPSGEASAGRRDAGGLGALRELRVEGLTCTHGGTQGVRDISFVLREGTWTAITGPVGAGKTTLLRAVLGLLPKDGGRLAWNGEEVADPAAFMPWRAAYVPQVPALFAGTLRENVCMGVVADDAELRRASDLAMLSGDILRMARGWDTRIGALGVRLSGGQAQRVAIARALVRRPELLVLDDVSSALDQDTERRLFEALTAAGLSCLVVTANPTVLNSARQVVRLEGGRIAATSCPP